MSDMGKCCVPIDEAIKAAYSIFFVMTVAAYLSKCIELIKPLAPPRGRIKQNTLFNGDTPWNKSITGFYTSWA